MPTDNTADRSHPGVDSPDMAADAPTPPATPDHPGPATDAPRPSDERSGDGHDVLADGTIILAAPYPTTPPMRMPDKTWAMLITGVDICDHGDRTGEVELFTGCWESDPTPASDDYEGDLVVRLAPPSPTGARNEASRVDIEMALAYQDRWQQVGLWPGLGPDWPHIVAPTARAVMWLHTDLLETRHPAPPRGVWP